MSSFKDRIKELRISRNLTLGEMGKILNKSESTISLYENGKREPKSSEDYIFIANTFNISLDYLMGIADTVIPNDILNISNNTNVFGDRLKLLRSQKDILSKDFAKTMNVEPATVTNWEKGNRFPDRDILVQIADYFNVSLDYLLRGENINYYNNTINDTFVISDTLKDRIKQLRLKKEINQPQLAKIMNVSKQTVSNWENGNRVPDTFTLYSLADYFNVSIDYLLGRTNYSNESELINELNRVKNELNTICKRITDLKMR